MARERRRTAASAPEPIHDWSTPGKRIEWLVNLRFGGNRSEMARSIAFSHTAISRVVTGALPPGRRLLTAIANKLGVSADWLLNGVGDPFGVKRTAVDADVWLQTSDALLSSPPGGPADPKLTSSIQSPTFRPPTQYWFRLLRQQSILQYPTYGFRQNDLLLMETDRGRFPSEESFADQLCAVRIQGGREAVKFGAVEFVKGGPSNGPSRLEAETFEDGPDRYAKEEVFRRLPDGSYEHRTRLAEKKSFRGRTFYTSSDLGPHHDTLWGRHRIGYTDILAIWTGLVFRRDQSPYG